MLFLSHTEIRVRIPPGVGIDIPVRVFVGQREANPLSFNFDPPFVEDISPSFPDANGYILTLVGLNFAPTKELAGQIAIVVGTDIYNNDGDGNFTTKLDEVHTANILRCRVPNVATKGK